MFNIAMKIKTNLFVFMAFFMTKINILSKFIFSVDLFSQMTKITKKEYLYGF